MTHFLVNLILAGLWVFLWGQLSLYTLLVGFAGGYAILYLFTRVRLPGILRDAYANRVIDGVRFSLYFIGLLIKSNLQLAWEVITPGFQMKPRLLRYEVTGLTDAQLAAFSSATTLTPGTLVVDVRDAADDRRYIYVHCMYAENRVDATRSLDELRNRMSRDLFRIPPRSVEIIEAKNKETP